MKTWRHLGTLALLFPLMTFLACSSDDDATTPAQQDPTLTGTSVSYDLNDVGQGISGTAKFEELSDNTTKVTIELQGTPDGGSHPTHIHLNNTIETGGIAISLTPVDGTTGKSETTVTKQDDETAITYQELVAFEGYINVHLSMDDLATIVAQGDIGSSALTGDTKTYTLEERTIDDISGTATFAKRINGETLITLSLTGTPDDGMHLAHIHVNSALEGGGIAVSLSSVDGSSGMSVTNVSQLDDNTAITYDELIAYDGYINVHLSMDDLPTIVAQGDIGGNALTGTEVSYTLGEKDVDGISGTALFQERENGNTLVTLTLTGTPADGMHPAHIHDNDASEGGPIALSFTPVDGTTGMSMTHIEALDDDTPITYSGLTGFDGYINVHLSMDELATIVAQGNIGSNAE